MNGTLITTVIFALEIKRQKNEKEHLVIRINHRGYPVCQYDRHGQHDVQ